MNRSGTVLNAKTLRCVFIHLFHSLCLSITYISLCIFIQFFLSISHLHHVSHITCLLFLSDIYFHLSFLLFLILSILTVCLILAFFFHPHCLTLYCSLYITVSIVSFSFASYRFPSLSIPRLTNNYNSMHYGYPSSSWIQSKCSTDCRIALDIPKIVQFLTFPFFVFLSITFSIYLVLLSSIIVYVLHVILLFLSLLLSVCLLDAQ